MSINNQLIGTSDTTVYSSSGASAVTTMFICNNSTTQDVIINIHIVPNGYSGGADNSNRIIKDLNLLATDTFVFGTERLLLGNGDEIVMTASTGSIASSTVSYTEI